MTDDAVLITGAAGFIGFCLARRLLEGGRAVVGVDTSTPITIRRSRRHDSPSFASSRTSLFTGSISPTAGSPHRCLATAISDRSCILPLRPECATRWRILTPISMLTGFLNILEVCRHRRTPHLVFASLSSVYGANTKLPFSMHDNVDHPVSLYGATKKSNELMAHAYSHLYALPTTGLRFFAVYGPWGRPDMAMFIFAKAMVEGAPIRLFNYGRMRRDFTYVDDVVEAVERLIARPPAAAIADLDPARSPHPGESTTSATTARWRFPGSSSSWNRNSDTRRRPNSYRCSPATCRRPAPMSTT
jgi:UDP-glucuronate 4-epimerase